MNRTTAIFAPDPWAGRHYELWQVPWTPLRYQTSRAKWLGTSVYTTLFWDIGKVQ